jgi:FlaA1/EpsC-like NDP-sugar epimerase
VLLSHVPLSIAERSRAYFDKYEKHQIFHYQVAKYAATVLFALFATLAILSFVDVISWRKGAVTFGMAAMCIGAFRLVIRAIAFRSWNSSCDHDRRLTDDEERTMLELLDQHPELIDVFTQWSIYTDQLSVTELNLVRSYCQQRN